MCDIEKRLGISAGLEKPCAEGDAKQDEEGERTRRACFVGQPIPLLTCRR